MGGEDVGGLKGGGQGDWRDWGWYWEALFTGNIRMFHSALCVRHQIYVLEGGTGDFMLCRVDFMCFIADI